MSDLDRLDGLFVGQLSPEELETFENAIAKGRAMRWYKGGAGFMGLAKVKVIASTPPAPEEQDGANRAHYNKPA